MPTHEWSSLPFNGKYEFICNSKDRAISIREDEKEEIEFCPSCGESLTCEHKIITDYGCIYNEKGKRIDVKICEECGMNIG